MVKLTYTKVSPDVCRTNRTFYKNHVRRAFIMWCAYEGYFDGVFSKSEIKKAKRGNLPEDCNVHHRLPLSGGTGDFINDFDNLTVIHKSTHERINKEVFSPQLRAITNAPFGTQIEIDAPDFGYVDIEGIKKERRLKQRIRKSNER